MDLSNGPRLGVYGSLLMLLGMVVMLAIGVLITVDVLAVVYPTAAGANGMLNSSINQTLITQQAQTEALSVLNQFTVPVIADIAIQIAGVLFLALSFAALGRTYKEDKMGRYGYYGAALIVAALVVELVGPQVLGMAVFVLELIGFLIYMFVLRYISRSTASNKFRYYGYGLVAGALLNLINPIGTIIFIVVFALMALEFRNAGAAAAQGGKSPFDTAEITSGASLKRKTSNKDKK